MEDIEQAVDFEAPGERTSPLWMVTREPRLNALVAYLADMRPRLEANPHGPHRFVFSRALLAETRAAFAEVIRAGESRLHRLCALLCDSFFPGRYELESVVVAEVPATRERFMLSRVISPGELDLLTDLDLGQREIGRLRYFDGAGFSRAALVANFVEYQPFAANAHGIVKLGSRIKAEEEIWNKVADELFELDRLVQRDKKLRRMSRYVKDVFGLKIVVGDRRRVRRLHEVLAAIEWPDEFLRAHGVEGDESTRRLSVLEVKDYLGDAKKSGWSAVKSVVMWGGTPFEIQVQPLRNHLRERERLTRESHAAFKQRREALRDEVARAIPAFGVYRDLLHWIFRAPSDEPPALPRGIEIEIRD